MSTDPLTDEQIRRLCAHPPGTRYLLTEGDGPEREVTAEEWISAERRAGFHPKPGLGPFATAGFGSTNPDLHGRIEYPTPEQRAAATLAASVARADDALAYLDAHPRDDNRLTDADREALAPAQAAMGEAIDALGDYLASQLAGGRVARAGGVVVDEPEPLDLRRPWALLIASGVVGLVVAVFGIVALLR